ncbi:MAG: coproporphyrinogen III oxidase, partial [Nitratireductor sp.]|nr:coproporphyrinogen III oxidase [Nitratireductor sp.]
MPDTAAIIAKYSQNIPRYTSYPTAPHFRNDEGGRLVETMLSSIGQHERISLYLHIPFCDKLCWFCGCHTKHTLQYAPVEA